MMKMGGQQFSVFFLTVLLMPGFSHSRPIHHLCFDKCQLNDKYGEMHVTMLHGGLTCTNGSGLSFDGTPKYAEAKSVPLGGTDLTFVGWASFSSFSGKDQRIFDFGYSEYSDPQRYLTLTQDDSKRSVKILSKHLHFDSYVTSGEASLLDNVIFHFAVTWEYSGSAEARMYIDGTLVMVNSCGNMPISRLKRAHHFFGKSTIPGASNFQGTIHAFSIYDRILSSDEIQQLYRRGEGYHDRCAEITGTQAPISPTAAPTIVPCDGTKVSGYNLSHSGIFTGCQMMKNTNSAQECADVCSGDPLCIAFSRDAYGGCFTCYRGTDLSPDSQPGAEAYFRCQQLPAGQPDTSRIATKSPTGLGLGHSSLPSNHICFKNCTLTDKYGSMDATLHGLTCQIGTGLQFYGFGFASLASVELGGEDFTITGWARFDQFSGKTWQRIFDFGVGSSTNFFFGQVKGYPHVGFSHSAASATGSAGGLLPAPQYIYPGEVFHFATLYIYREHASVQMIYINGKLAAKRSCGVPKISRQLVTSNYLGWSQDSSHSKLSGAIHALSIYRRALRDDEVQFLYGKGTQGDYCAETSLRTSAPTMTTSPTSLPTVQTKLYVQTQHESSDCPSGYVVVTSFEECYGKAFEYLKLEGHVNQRWTGISPDENHWPYCYEGYGGTAGNGNIYFSDLANSGGKRGYRICKLATMAVTKNPTIAPPQQPYIQTSSESADCPSGYSVVTSIQECFGMAFQYLKKHFQVKTRYNSYSKADHWPYCHEGYGSWHGGDGNGNMHYNLEVGPGKRGYRICKLTTTSPTLAPTFTPSTSFSPSTVSPSLSPTESPSLSPTTISPSLSPTESPSSSPTTKVPVTLMPSASPATLLPSVSPTNSPTISPSTTSPTLQPLALEEARLSDSVTYVILRLNLATNAPRLLCEDLLTTETLAKIGRDPTCLWQDGGRTLHLLLGSGFSLRVGDIVGFKGGVLGEANTGTNSNPASTQLLKPPLSVAKPRAVVMGLQTVGLCDDASVDASSSTGGYGIPLDIRWSYQGPTPQLANYVSGKKDYRLSLLPTNLTTGQHRFTATVTNWLNQTDVGVLYMTRVTVELPEVVLPCPNPLRMRTSEGHILRAKYSAPCGARGYNKVQWSLLGRSSPDLDNFAEQYRHVLEETAALTLPNPNVAYLEIPKHFFKMGGTYALKLRVKSILNGQMIGEVNTTLIVEVLDEPLFAQIGHGERFMEVFLPSSSASSLTLDGSGSKDVGTHIPIQTFHWHIRERFPLLSSSFQNVSMISSSPIMRVSSNILPAGEYIVVLTVTSTPLETIAASLNATNNGLNRSAIATQIIRVSEVPVPRISIYLRSHPVSSSSLAKGGGYRVNPDAKITLYGNVTSAELRSGVANEMQDSFFWSIPSHEAQNLLSPSSKFLLSPSANASHLVLRPHVLHGGESYVIRLQVSEKLQGGMMTHGKAEIMLSVNEGPTLGLCGPNGPREGVSMRTQFRLRCVDWADEDLPLSFKFQEADVAASNNGAMEFFDLNKYQASSTYSTLLFAKPNSKRTVQVRALIRDALGAVTVFSNQSLLTFQVQGNVEVDISSMMEEVEMAKQTGDFINVALYFRAIVDSATPSENEIESGSSPERSAAKAREDLISSVKGLAGATAGLTGDDAIEVPLELMEKVSAFPVGKPDVISSKTRSVVLQMATTLLSNSTDSLSDNAIRLATSTIGSIAQSVSDTKNTTASRTTRRKTLVNSEERIEVAAKAERLLVNITEALLATVSVGEAPAEVHTPAAVLAAQRKTTTDAPGSVIEVELGSGDAQATSSSSNSSFSVTMSPSLVFPTSGDGSPDDVGMKIVWMGSRPYPNDDAGQQSDDQKSVIPVDMQLTIELAQNGDPVHVEHTQQPFLIQFPLTLEDQKEREKGGGKSYDAACQFWSNEHRSWDSEGVAFGNFTNDTHPFHGSLVCLSHHLTSFSVDINTVDEDSVDNPEVYSFANPLTLFLLVFITFFALTFFVALQRDWKVYEDHGDMAAAEFWRKYNYMSDLRLAQARSWNSYEESVKWAVSRKHTWTSIVARHNGDYLSSAKRTMILLVLLLNGMTVLALLLEKQAELGPFLSADTSMSLISMIMSFPVPMILLTVLNRPVPLSFRVPRNMLSSYGAGWMSWIFCLLMLVMGEMQIQAEEGGDLQMDSGEDENVVMAEEGDDNDDGGGDANDDGDDDDDGGDEAKNRDVEQKIFPAVPMIAGQIAGQEAASAKENGRTYRLKDKKPGVRLKDVVLTSTDKKPKDVSGNEVPRCQLPGTVQEDLKHVNKSNNERIITLETKKSHRRLKRSANMSLSMTGSALLLPSLGEDGPELARSSTTFLTITSRGKDESKDEQREKKCFSTENVFREHTGSPETYRWWRRDTFAIAACTVISLGCCFILLNLAWSLRDKHYNWVKDTIFLFGADACSRFFSIVVLEAALLVPLCGMQYFMKSEKQEKAFAAKARNLEKWKGLVATKYSQKNGTKFRRVRFTSGIDIGFEYRSCRISNVEEKTQADEFGLEVGWRVFKVEGEPVFNDRHLEYNLQRAHRMYTEFEIEFACLPKKEKDDNSVVESEFSWLSESEIERQSKQYWRVGQAKNSDLMRRKKSTALMHKFLGITTSEIDDFDESSCSSSVAEEPGSSSIEC